MPIQRGIGTTAAALDWLDDFVRRRAVTPEQARVLGLVVAEGRHQAIAAGSQAGLESLGLKLVARPEDRSATVTAAWLPEGLDWAPFNADMRGRGLIVAGGQGKWAGRIMRFGHMGMVEIEEMVEAVRVMGETMGDHGFQPDVSAAMAATQGAYDAARSAAAR